MSTDNATTAHVHAVVQPLYVVQLDDGCWLADGEGDPPRTLVKANARRFTTPLKAGRGVHAARQYRPFRRAEIHREDVDKQLAGTSGRPSEST